MQNINQNTDIQLNKSLQIILKNQFGYDDFRGDQLQIIKNCLSNKSSLVLMPTGGGKSLCYQLPALCLPGITLVISPLIALMKDQVDSLVLNGIPASAFTSDLNSEQKDQLKKDCQNGKIKLLYVSPERLSNPYFLEFLQSISLSLLAVDEAHCISEWGHEFRPDYRNISHIRQKLNHIPCIALTATATSSVIKDIQTNLNLNQSDLFTSSFDRPNIHYYIQPKKDAYSHLLSELQEVKDGATIIYRFSKKGCEQLALKLQKSGYKAKAYHAGMGSKARSDIQEAFIKDQIQIIVATIAFGMGINKPDVRLVIHYELPKSIEAYFQQTGRAGRDGELSKCVLFYTYADVRKHQYFIDQAEINKNHLQNLLQQMIDYSEHLYCRRAYLLSYFSQNYEKDNCESCDRCLNPIDSIQAKEQIRSILTLIEKTGQRWGLSMIIDILRGARTKKILEFNYDQIKGHGSLKEYSKEQVRSFLSQLEHKNVLYKTIGQYPILKISKKGFMDFIAKNNFQLFLIQKPKTSSTKKDLSLYNQDLYEKLKELRSRFAIDLSIPPYMVFSNKSLIEMAQYYPQTIDQFFLIHGVGKRKANDFAKPFLSLIKDYLQSNFITKINFDLSIQVISQKNQPKDKNTHSFSSEYIEITSTYKKTAELAEQKLSIKQIAKLRNISQDTVISHLEKLSKSTEYEINLDYLKHSIKDFFIIEKTFKKLNTPGHKLKPVYLELGEKYSYQLLKVVRIFL